MGEAQAHQPRRMAMRGEIVEVEGGHIVRSTGRKDRHSKVCTAKGPRDRRVRLSAHTAIQFYDVQDRLGYDRPSKAVDWLINKAKAAIDDLAKLPAWDPNTFNDKNQSETAIGLHHPAAVDDSGGGRIVQQLGENQNGGGGSGFLPLDSDIADSIKCFFPVGTTAPETNSPSIHFQNFPPDLLSRTSSSSQNQDLRLSLQSLQDPILLHQAQTHHSHHHHQQQQNEHEHEHLFSATTSLGFDEASYSEEHGRFNRMVAWNADDHDTGNGGNDGAGGGGGGGFIFNSPSPVPILLPPPPPLFGHSQYVSQRGPLQSSNTPSIRAWIDPTIAAATTDNYHHHYLAPTFLHHHYQSAISGGFSGFRIPARIQGEEEHDGVSDKPSSASSDSHH